MKKEKSVFTEERARQEAKANSDAKINFTSEGPEYIQQLKNAAETMIIDEENSAIEDYRLNEQSIKSIERDLNNKRETLGEYRQELHLKSIDYVIDTSRNISTNLASAIQVVMAAGETTFNKIIFAVAGLNIIDTWVLALIVGLMFVSLAHLTGMWKKRGKIYYAIGSGLFVVIALISVAYARTMYFANADTSIIGTNVDSVKLSIIFLGANLLLSAVAFFVGYEHSDEYPKVQKTKRKIEELELNLEDLYQEQKKKTEIHLANAEKRVAKFKFYEAAYFNEYNRLTGSQNEHNTTPPTIPDMLYELAGKNPREGKENVNVLSSTKPVSLVKPDGE